MTDVSLMTKASQTVQEAMSKLDYGDYSEFQSKWVLVATWHNVSDSSDSTEVPSIGLLVSLGIR